MFKLVEISKSLLQDVNCLNPCPYAINGGAKALMGVFAFEWLWLWLL